MCFLSIHSHVTVVRIAAVFVRIARIAAVFVELEAIAAVVVRIARIVGVVVSSSNSSSALEALLSQR